LSGLMDLPQGTTSGSVRGDDGGDGDDDTSRHRVLVRFV
jgi:hypothetical protein